MTDGPSRRVDGTSPAATPDGGAPPLLGATTVGNERRHATLARRRVPPRRHLRRLRHQLLGVLRGCHAHRPVPVRPRRPRGHHRTPPGDPRPAHRGRRLLLARLPPGRRARYPVRVPRARPLGPRRRACGATRASCCSTPTPRPSTAPSTGPRRASRTGSASRSAATTTTRPATSPRRSSTTRTSTGATTGRPPSRCTRPSSTSCTSRASPPATPTCRPSCAAPTPGSPTPPSSSTSSTSASPPSSCSRSTSSSTTPTWSTAACATTGATTPSATSPRTTSTRSAGTTGAQVQEFKTMVKLLHEAGIEVILDVVYNHTAEGNHLGPMLSFKGHRQRRLLPAHRGPPVLHGLHRHRQQPEHAPPPRAAADHGLAALLGHRDARRRLPLRPRRHPRPGAARGRPPLGVLRPHPAGPGRQPGQAHRRALGRRRGRLPGRQLPRPLVGVERQVPRHRARLLARRGLHHRRVRLPLHRLQRPLRVRQPPPVRQRQLRHRPRRVHPRRPGLLQRQAQRGQRRGQPRRREPQPLLELRRRGPDRRPRRRSPCARRQQRNLLATLLLSQGVPMLLDGRRGRPHPGRQQQRLLPGQRGLLVRLGRRRRRTCSAFTRRLLAPAPRPPRVPPPPVVHRPLHPRRRPRHRLVPPRRHADDRRGLGRRLRQEPRHGPQRAGHPLAGAPRRADRRRHLPRRLQRPLPAPHLGHPARAVGAPSGPCCSTPPGPRSDGGPDATTVPAGETFEVVARSVQVLRGLGPPADT